MKKSYRYTHAQASTQAQLLYGDLTARNLHAAAWDAGRSPSFTCMFLMHALSHFATACAHATSISTAYQDVGRTIEAQQTMWQ